MHPIGVTRELIVGQEFYGTTLVFLVPRKVSHFVSCEYRNPSYVAIICAAAAARPAGASHSMRGQTREKRVEQPRSPGYPHIT